MNVSMSNGNLTSQACAACKFQRRKCPSDCPLAPYFPAEANQRFLSCKRLFGVSNMLRFLRDADPSDRDDTMKSLIYEAECRDKDPVNGCFGVITRLADQVKCLQRELEVTRSLLHQQHCQPPIVHQSDLVGIGGVTVQHPMALPLQTFRQNGTSTLGLEDFEFEAQLDNKYILRP